MSMVSAIARTPAQSMQPLWDYEATQAVLQKTVLNPTNQKYADIINDRSGHYSESEKIDAYKRALNSFSVTRTFRRDDGLLTTEVSATQEQSLQALKFDDVIGNSDIGKAVTEGNQILSSFERTQGINGDSDRFQLFAKFSDLEKKLPQFKDFGTPLEVLFEQTAKRVQQDIISLSKEAQLLSGRSQDGSVIRPTWG
jgi:hypothetical protein